MSRLLSVLLYLVTYLVTMHVAWGQVLEPIRRALRAETQGGPTELATFYAARDHNPIWFDEFGRPRADAIVLIDILQNAGLDGLDRERYVTSELAALAAERCLATFPTERTEAEQLNGDEISHADLVVSRAFMQYISDLYAGRVRPDEIHPGWPVASDRNHFLELLTDRWTDGRLDSYVDRFAPPFEEYSLLKRALATYRRIAETGGWPLQEDYVRLELGDSSSAVSSLRWRLSLEQEMVNPERRPEVFDRLLEDAVRAYQNRHGLEPDGIVGPRTLASLNVPAADRVRQIELSMERWRWIPKEHQPRFIVVNTAGGTLTAYENGSARVNMKVIAGKKSTPTPLFHSRVAGVVLAPYWNVPRSIATGEILPKLRSNPNYLPVNRMRLFLNGREVAVSTIDWSSVSARGFPYRIRQDPGPGNPMGRIKFDIPNAYGIGLHDTSEPGLFLKTDCHFSHGCIRIENPMELALYALDGTGDWTEAKLDDVIGWRKETRITLSSPIPIYVSYWTTWVDADLEVQFRDDLYEYDVRLRHQIEQAGSIIRTDLLGTQSDLCRLTSSTTASTNGLMALYR